MTSSRAGSIFFALALVVAIGCSSEQGSRTAAPEDMVSSPSVIPTLEAAPASPTRDPLPRGVSEPPAWLGKRVLPQRPDGLGIARVTPPLLRDRRLATVDLLPPPAGRRFVSSIRPAPSSVLRRSTWGPMCPVRADELACVRVAFWGFDRGPHTGELLVHNSVARDIVSVFERLHRARWPIEEMRITRAAELNAPPTGDGNNTTAFACRPARLTTTWSQHAYGLAVDVNPFHNPYVRGDVVLPERAIAYRNRDRRRPGMIHPGDLVTRAFARIGWEWGGTWSSSKDWMHFSRSGG